MLIDLHKCITRRRTQAARTALMNISFVSKYVALVGVP
jgi:hypothetical protein